jgi:hypothetical protein
MRSGYWVVALFATGWAGAGLLATGYPLVALLLPVLVSGAVLFWAYRVPATARELGSHTRKALARWSMIEGVAIMVAVNVLHRVHRPDLMFPVVAVIVGLHFLPLARTIPVRVYFLTAAALMVIGAVGMLLPSSDRPLAVGLGAAVALWATGLSRAERRRP